jgi:hypothetical protein
MKKLFLLAITMLAMLSVSYAQYQYDASFPNTSLSADSALIVGGNGLHGVAVGLDGNVWAIPYNTYIKGDSLPTKSYKTGNDTTIAVLALRIYKPDGTPASFSPLMILSGAGVTDTLFKGGINGGTEGGTGRGLSNTPDGNILFVWFSNVYLLDYRTGAVLLKFKASCIGTHGNTAAAADVAGDIFTGPVFGGESPIEMTDKNGVKQGNVVDLTGYFSRTLTCSRAGDKVYYAGYTGHCVVRYSGDPLAGFTADTVLKGFDCESITRSGQTDMLWASAGSGNDMPNRYPDVATSYSSHTWYLWDPATEEVKDSIKWNGLENFVGADSLGVRPRSVSTTKDGDTVYVAMFGAKTGMYNVQRFVKSATSVHRNNDAVADNFTLSQNYPNPFNPSTKIQFTLKSNSVISMKIYDVLGKEVSTLAEGAYSAGAYTVNFDATNLSAGIYFYTLRTADGFVQSKKMLLIK